MEKEITNIVRPLFASQVPAGFPSAADDYVEKYLDLNKKLIPNPAATFFVQVTGDSMKDIGIISGDLLVIDRSLQAQHRSIILAVVNTEFTVKRLLKKDGQMWLAPENSKYRPLQITQEMDFEVWGVVTHCIHSFK